MLGCVVSGKASSQHVPALSTTEAEFIAATEATKRGWRCCWDLRSAVQLTENQVYHERLKHRDVELHLTRDQIQMVPSFKFMEFLDLMDWELQVTDTSEIVVSN